MFKVESLDKKSCISFRYKEYEDVPIPSISFSISVENEEYRGTNKSVWFEIDKFKNFVDDLITLNTTRQGYAEVEAMSPNDFYLRIESIDRSGHLGLKYKISRCLYSPNYINLSLSGGFELDPSMFDELVKGFKMMVYFS